MSFIACNQSFVKKFLPVSFEKLKKLIIEQKLANEFYFVAATNQLALNFKLNFVDLYYQFNKEPLVNFTISNFEGFVKKLFDEIKPKRFWKVLSDSYRFLIFKEAFDKASLTFFKQNNEKISLYMIKWLSQIVFGLKEDGITPVNFEKELSRQDESIVNIGKFIDTKTLFSEYQNILVQNNLYDIVDATKYVANYLKEIFNKKMMSTPKPNLPMLKEKIALLFFGFYDFKVPEIELLGALAKFDNPIAIFLDFDETNGPLFGNYNDLLINLKKSGYIEISIENKEENSNTNFLKKNLFNNIYGKSRPELVDTIKIFAAQNKYSEAKLIAKLCKYLIAVKGFKPSEICITTKNPQAYSYLFREVFYDVCIPINLMERFRLSSSPLIISILSALNVVARGFRFKDLRKVLLNFYFRFGTYDELGNFTSIDVGNFLEVASAMRGLGGEELGGKKYWIRRFENRLKAIDERIAFSKASYFPDEMELINYKVEKSRLEKAKNDFLVMLSYFDFENKNVSIDEFYDIVLNKIIKKFGVFEILENVVEHLLNSLPSLDTDEKISKIEEVEKDARALSKFLMLLEEFVFITKERYGNREYSLSELVELLSVIIFEERYQISRKSNYGITITTIEQTRGIPYKVMILCGAVDGDIPKRYSPEKFLGKELGKSEKRHFENERLEFFFFLTNNSQLFDNNERLTYIFYPKKDAKKDFVPSPFLFSLCDLFGIRKGEAIFDLTLPVDAGNFQLEWLETIVSKVEKNLTVKNLEAELSDSMFLKHVASIYFRKWTTNQLDKKNLTQITKEFIKNLTLKPISITFLEQYNKCPFQFFVDRILKIEKPDEEIELFLTNREKGEILHLILAYFYKTLAEEVSKEGKYEFKLEFGTKSYYPVKISFEKKDEYLRLLKTLTRNILEKFNTEISLFEIDIEEFFSSEPQRIGLVQLWLNYELKKSFWKTLPTLFEFSFGLSTKDSIEPIEIELSQNEKIKVRGKIDRIDIYIDEDGLEFSIVDYKLSESDVANWGKVSRGLSFQMPFYALVFSNLLHKYSDKIIYAINLLYQIFNYKSEKNDKNNLNYKDLYIDNKSVIYKYFKPKTSKKDLIDIQVNLQVAKQKAEETLVNIKSKLNFPVRPFNMFSICNYCKFNLICKKDIF